MSSALTVIPVPAPAFNVGIGPDKFVPVKPSPAIIAVKSPYTLDQTSFAPPDILAVTHIFNTLSVVL